MFALVEMRGEIRPVHSKRDLEYMVNRGWKLVEAPAPDPVPAIKPDPARPILHLKKAKQ